MFEDENLFNPLNLNDPLQTNSDIVSGSFRIPQFQGGVNPFGIDEKVISERLVAENLGAQGVNSIFKRDDIKQIQNAADNFVGQNDFVNRNIFGNGDGRPEPEERVVVDRFINPFEGTDLNTSLFRLGQSIGFDSDNSRDRGVNTFRGVAAAGKSILNIGRLIGAGIGIQNRDNEVAAHKRREIRDSLVNNFKAEDGGKVGDIDLTKILTGEVISETPNNNVNVEAEDGEFAKHPNGDVQRIEGATHEQGGVKLDLEEGTKIVSNNLKVTKDFAKKLNSEYDLKVTTKDTYSQVIDKYTKKIGLDALNKEQEELFSNLEKQKEVEDTSTNNLNISFLSNKIKDVEIKKEDLLSKRADFTDLIFNEQEVNKGSKGSPDFMRNGGLTSSPLFKELMDKYQLKEEDALHVMQMFEDGGEVSDDPITKLKLKLIKNNYNTSTLSPRERQTLTEVMGSSNISGNVKDLKAVVDRLKELERLNPVLTRDAFAFGTGEDGSLTFDLSPENILKFQQGFNKNTNSIKDFIQNSNDFSEAEKKQIISNLNNEIFEEGNVNSARDFDSIFGNFTSSRPGLQFNAVTPTDLKKLQAQGITSYKELFDAEGNIKADLDLSDKSKEQLKRFEGIQGNFLLGDFTTPEPKSEAPNVNTDSEVPALRDVRTRRALGFLALPDQSVVPPDGVQPHLKIDRTFDRLDPVEISVEENLKELFRSQDFTTNQLNNLPDSQRRAVLGSVTANTQENINRAVSETAKQNALIKLQTDQTNLQQSNMEVNFNASDLLDFERRQLIAEGKTKADINAFFDYNRRVRLGNFNTINRMNLLNDIYENFNSDGRGISLDESRKVNFNFDPNLAQILSQSNNKNQ